MLVAASVERAGLIEVVRLIAGGRLRVAVVSSDIRTLLVAAASLSPPPSRSSWRARVAAAVVNLAESSPAWLRVLGTDQVCAAVTPHVGGGCLSSQSVGGWRLTL